MLDLIVRGGLVVDGTGVPCIPADVGISQGRIVEVGRLGAAEAADSLDARGLVVTPGFIDIHSHSDYTLLVDPRALSQIYQGVTTEVVGNCGHGCAPVGPDPALIHANIYGYQPGVELAWTGMAGYLERLEEAGPAVNVATLVPNGNLRLAAMGIKERPALAAELARMIRLLEEGLDAGAIGFSTGLEYPAERAASSEELVELCRVTAARGGFYATHTRNRELEAVEAIDEQVRVARSAGIRLQISHIIPRRGGDPDSWVRALELVDRAREDGQDIAFDSHTRLHGITNLSNALPPAEFAASPRELAASLRDPGHRADLKRHQSIISSFGLGGWERVFLFSSPHLPGRVGKSFAELAPAGGDALDAVYEVLLAEASDPHAPMCLCHSYEEEWLRTTFKHPLCMPGSDATALCPDGPLGGATFLGAYTWAGWFFRRLVRETGDLSLEEGVRKLTSLPADTARLQGRGRVLPGAFADLAVFSAAEFGERGSNESPNLPAAGMRHVVVNGTVAMRDGGLTGDRSGQVIRA